MRRLPPIEIAIVVILAVGIAIGWRIYGTGEFGRFGGAEHAQRAPSALYARLTIRYPKPPIFEESYDMQDVEGISSFQYRIRSYQCAQVTVKAPAGPSYDVSFFFGQLDQDGIWQLTNKAPRPDADAYYTVYVKQLADYKQGERTVTFTDPHYWATTAGRQFQIDLSKQNPSDLLQLQSTRLADPRYQKIVQDFRNFGPPEFRRNVAGAARRARSAVCK
ncbi:MAG TPA: hypothetical protein VMF61_10795 [Candidatus Acidoferrales bacterium]|nr:hypothetical protein [Candidatus Acidoferrales bacterium]